MKILCVIPSRIGSIRLPRKALLPIQGKPMVQWTYENASKCKLLTKVVVATDSEEIASVIKNCGGDVEMTSADLKTGSDRVAEVAKKYPEMDVVINLQGDEPFITPKMLDQLIEPYLNGGSPAMTTLASKTLHWENHYPHSTSVKVITDINNNALYFSRSPIPYFTKEILEKTPVYRHLGIYAFQRDFLLKYATLPQTPLELAESLEQLRALEHGYQIKVCLTEDKTLDINYPEDLKAAQNF